MTDIITVDGPSGSGKGTICRILANTLGYSLLDSGALYRIVALAAIDSELPLDDEPGLTKLTESLKIEFRSAGDSTQTLLSDKDVSRAIREERVGMVASKVARFNDVRAALLERQRNFAVGNGLVADGRDMGTVVFPAAKNKFFLTASAEERARRRVLQLEQGGDNSVDYGHILNDIRARDERDTQRAVAPLKPADDAILIDSTNLSIDEVVNIITRQLAN